MIHISYLLSYLRPVEERLAPFTCQCSAWAFSSDLTDSENRADDSDAPQPHSKRRASSCPLLMLR